MMEALKITGVDYCPICDLPLREARGYANYDEGGYHYFRCAGCGTLLKYKIGEPTF